jgi:hypothetical protein
MFGPLVGSGIAGIGEASSRPCGTAAIWLMSASLAAVPVTVCTTPEATSTPICAPELVEGHPEVPLVALPGLVHLRVAALTLVLGRGRGGDDPRLREGRIDDRAPGFRRGKLWRINSPRSSSIAPTSSNNTLVSSWLSSQWRKCSTVVASGTLSTARSMLAKPRKAWLS